MFRITLLALLCFALARPAQALDDATLQKATAGVEARQAAFRKALLSHPPDFAKKNTMWDYSNYALAAYWANEHLPEADQAMIVASQRDAVRWRGNDDAPTSKHSYYKQLYLLERVYFLFNSRSEYFPGRMGAVAENAVSEMLWQWISGACRKSALAPENDWHQWGTENIGAITWSSMWGAAQIVAEHPAYRDLKYADGTPVVEMARAFDEYYKRFTRERAGKGLLIEVASHYNSWTFNGWYNIADFARDPVTRQRMRMFLDLYFADWAIEQIDGMRGGSRHRCYAGPGSTELSDGGANPAWFLFGVGPTKSTNPALTGPATTFYRPSPVVTDLVLDVKGRGTYPYLTRRPGLGHTVNKLGGGIGFGEAEEFLGEAGGHLLEPDGGKLLRYTWCTPDFVMGTSMVPPLPAEAWALISSQNRWEGVIFGGHETARIFVQPIAKGSFYNATWSVQDKGVMIVQRLKTNIGCAGQHFWFDQSLKREEAGGWYFAEAPRAYAAVRPVEGGAAWEPDQPKNAKTKPGPGLWLRCEQEFTPIILEVVPKSAFPDFAAFQKAIAANPLTWENRRLQYRSGFYKTELTLWADYSQVPQVNGKPLNYEPAQAYDSPYLQGDFGQGIVTIQKDNRRLVLDFTKE